jgi:hypothetical protein
MGVPRGRFLEMLKNSRKCVSEAVHQGCKTAENFLLAEILPVERGPDDELFTAA